MLANATRSRTLVRAVFSLLAVSAIFSASPAAAARAARCSHASVPPGARTLRAASAAIVCLVNAQRTRRGLPALRRDADLEQAARGHAADMVRHAYFSHVSPGGQSVADRIQRAGYGRPGHGWQAGETLGWGSGAASTPAALVRGWLASPPHRQILLDPGYRELGVGVAAGAPQDIGGLPGATYAVDFGVIR